LGGLCHSHPPKVRQCLYNWKLYLDILEYEREALANGQDPNASVIQVATVLPEGAGNNAVHLLKVHPSVAGGPRSEPEGPDEPSQPSQPRSEGQ